jgi:3-dehydroquinate dehydratase/shikimate dehydrogenase
MAIVVSHIASDFDALSKQVLRQAKLADLVELRLDRIGNPGEAKLAALIRDARKPVVVACPGPEAFGHFRGSDDERLDLLRTAARVGAAFVDVDWRLSLDLGEVRGAGKCHRIVSRHETDGTPADLSAMLEEVRAVLYEGDLVKLVTHASSCLDGLRMLAFVRSEGGGLIGFCSGEKGSFTRVLAPIFGSPFTYAAPAILPGAESSSAAPEATAPGQLRVNDLRALLPPTGLSASTAIFAVVGNPARHSWSPRVHGMALKAGRLDAVYVALEPDELGAFLELARDENFRGFSVTAPFKEKAFELASSRDSAAEATRAANTLLRESRGWRALNTDVHAVQEVLDRAFQLHAQQPGRPVSIAAARTLVLGTGGSARAAAQAVREKRGQVTIAGRDPRKAERLARELGAEPVAWDAIPTIAYDVLVHCTPVGSLADPGQLPIQAEWIREGTLVLDAVYRPLKTPLLALALKKGCTPVPGGEWFVRQARAQFKLFTGQDADEALMRAAFSNAIVEETRTPSASG